MNNPESTQMSGDSLEGSIERIGVAYERFTLEVEAAQKEHGEMISKIIKGIEERKIGELRKEIKGL